MITAKDLESVLFQAIMSAEGPEGPILHTFSCVGHPEFELHMVRAPGLNTWSMTYLVAGVVCPDLHAVAEALNASAKEEGSDDV